MPTPLLPSPAERDAFYAASLVGLRALDARERSPRRFGAEADARWAAFSGALGLGDRVDLLLRDAAVTWGEAFSPALAFGLFGLPEDEPFGPDWRGLADDRARRLLADPPQPTLDAAAAALGQHPEPVDPGPLGPSTHLILAGGAAVLAVARAFQSRAELSWPDQVLVVASTPAHRQLAALAAPILGAASRTRLIRPAADAASTTRAAGFALLDRAIVSSDADPADAAFARRAAGAR